MSIDMQQIQVKTPAAAARPFSDLEKHEKGSFDAGHFRSPAHRQRITALARELAAAGGHRVGRPFTFLPSAEVAA
jgi:hypothetical protein